MTKWKAVVFDLDDTLYPERTYVLSGFRAVAQWGETHLNIPAERGYLELHTLFEQGVRNDTFNRWLSIHNLADDGLIQQLVAVYRTHSPSIKPFSEIPNLLDLLQRRYQLGIISDGYLETQKKKLAALELEHYFDVVVFSDEWGRTAWKPSPKPFEMLLQQLAIDASEAVYVADNPIKDFLGAHRVGMSTIWLRRPDGQYTQLSPPSRDFSPQITLTSITELKTILV